MNFSHFFFRRPIFPGALPIIIVLVGGLAVFPFPLPPYPQNAPPTVVVRCVYPGANPEGLAWHGRTAGYVVRCIREQTLQVPAGAIGQPPVPAGNDFQLTINTQGRLLDEQEFGDIIVKQGSEGQVTRIRDVARVELAARDYSVASQLSGKPAAALVIFQLPGSNAIETSDAVRAKLEELK